MDNSGKFLRVVNWETYQHYHTRKPPWIKLYWSLLCSPNVAGLSDACKHHVVAIMLLASQHDNKIPFIKSWIAKVIHAESRINWDAVLSCGLIECYQDASTLQASEVPRVYKEDKETYKEEESRVDNASSDTKSLSAEDIFTEIPCSGSSHQFQVSKTYILQMKELYPGIDVETETLHAKAWCINNPLKRKTNSGIPRFLGSWYTKAQNGSNGNGRGFQSPAATREEAAKQTYLKILEEQNGKQTKI